MNSAGQRMRAERERRGLSLDQVSSRARIPVRYLAALEQGDHAVLPPGPFLRGYRRQYLDFLGLPASDEPDLTDLSSEVTDKRQEEDEPTEDVRKPTMVRGREIPTARVVVVGIAIVLLAVVALRFGASLWGRADQRPVTEGSSPTGAAAPHRVTLRAIDPVAVAVRTDGGVAFDRTLEAGETQSFEGALRVDVDIADLTRVVVHYDGEKIEPLGSLSHGRRLVFLDSGSRK